MKNIKKKAKRNEASWNSLPLEFAPAKRRVKRPESHPDESKSKKGGRQDELHLDQKG